jgi:hypothetical protein
MICGSRACPMYPRGCYRNSSTRVAINVTLAKNLANARPGHHELISGCGKRCATFRDFSARENLSARVCCQAHS